MSGRKSGEVMDLLKSGELARGMTNGKLDNSIKNSCESIKRNKEKLNELKKAVKEANVEKISEEAKAMFPENGVHCEDKCHKSGEKISKLNVNQAETESALAEINELNKGLRSCDNEAASIRRSLKNKDWYCDDEYLRAQILKKRYEELAARRRELEKKMRNIASRAADTLCDAQAEKRNFDKLSESIREMNRMARNRKAADELKKQLQNDLHNVPEEWAEKFFLQDLKNIKNKLKRLLELSDENLIKEAPLFKEELNAFSSRLTEKIAVWEKQKNEAEQARKQAEDKSNTGFPDPFDYNVQGDNATKIKLFEYIYRYKKTNHSGRYQSKMHEASKAMNEERFIDAKKSFKEASDIADEAWNYALNLQENMIKAMELAKAIQNVMYNLNYDIKTTIINDNPGDGFRIICTAGDEVIDFTHIDYDKDGKPVVTIDHKESSSGSCHKSWKAITAAMRQNGIPLADVTKDGKSVISEGRRPKQTEHNHEGQVM